MAKNKKKKKTSDDTLVTTSTTDDNLQPCPICSKLYKSVNIHMSKGHPKEYQDLIANRYQPNSENDVADEVSIAESDEMKQIKSKIAVIDEKLEKMVVTRPSKDDFSDLVVQFADIMKESKDVLPGPKHPAKKQFEARKRRETFVNSQKEFSQSSNPQRSSKRDRDKRKEKYNFELLQHLYRYSRRKAVRMLLKSSFASSSCNIPLESLYESYNARWRVANNSILENYTSEYSDKQQFELDESYHCGITEGEVKQAVQGINSDSSSGLDGVAIRSVKEIGCFKTIALIGTIMETWTLVPECFRKARTILIHKKGDKSDVGNWRPISICSILRRIIERVLDRRLQTHVTINDNQVGFSKCPGTFINTSIVNGCLQKAKREKIDCCVVFLDVSKAFEETSHTHTTNMLHAKLLPSKLRSLILCLMADNVAQIQTSKGMSQPILVQKGVFQGSPLSPQLFNISIDHVLRELNEREISDAYGFHLHNDVPNVAGRGFADDVALVSGSVQGARELTKIAITNFNKVGYEINIQKCKVINIVKGKICEDPLVVDANNVIEAIKQDETVRYLGVNFNNEISFDPSSTIKNFTKDLQNLVGTPMLFPNQKIAIINQYLWPCLTYSLQTAPLNKLPKKFLEDLDKIIRSAVKEILAIPHDSPNALLYTSKKCRGLQIMRSTWEAFIQHYNICVVLLSCKDPFIPFVKDLQSEMESCISALQLNGDEVQVKLESCPKTKPSKILRNFLRDQEYDKWCSFALRGQGVELYKDCPYGNKIIIDKCGLTSSEWLNALKMSANVYPVRAIPGRSLESSLCRHCKEKETLAHVLGKCHVGSLLRTSRHHEVRTIIANHLRTLDWVVHEEVTDGASKRVDIICWRKELKSGYILDPTIRMEQSSSQAEEVNIEKQSHYNPCIPYFLDKYQLKKLEVVGLLVGARGTITGFFESFRKDLRLPSKMIEEIVVATIRGSCRIAHNHLYNMNLSHS